MRFFTRFLVLYPVIVLLVIGSLILRVRLDSGVWPRHIGSVIQSHISALNELSKAESEPGEQRRKPRGMAPNEVNETVEAFLDNLPAFSAYRNFSVKHYSVHGTISRVLLAGYPILGMIAVILGLFTWRSARSESVLLTVTWGISLAVILLQHEMWITWIID